MPANLINSSNKIELVQSRINWGSYQKSFYNDVREKRDSFLIKRLLLIAIPMLFLFAFLVFFFLNKAEFTGQAIVLGKTVFIQNEKLSGNFEILLKKGELIPSDSIVDVYFAGSTANLKLKDFVESMQEQYGNYYLSNAEISGTGNGFGFQGKQVEYPTVFFRLQPEIIGIMENAPVQEIEGTAFQGNDFAYNGIANLVPGSVRVSGKSLSDEAVSVTKENGKTIVSTAYYEEIYGFGKDFLSDEEQKIYLNLSRLNLAANDIGQQVLDVKISYNDKQIFFESQAIAVILPLESNETFNETAEMPTVEVPTILSNYAPTHNNPILNSTFGTNLITENITCYPQNLADLDGDAVYPIFNWKKNQNSYAALNLQFDSNISSNASGIIRDYSGFNNSATLGNGTDTYKPVWTAGIKGGAYQFDGINDYLEIPHSSSLDISKNLTISLWAKSPQIPGEACLIAKRGGTGTERYTIDQGNATRFSFYYYAPGLVDFYIDLNAPLVANRWYHLVLVYTYGDSSLKFYVNGTAQTVTTGKTPGVPVAQSKPVHIGACDAPSGQNFGYFNGSIDDVRIYNTTLSEQEISKIYLEGLNNLNSSTIVSQELKSRDKWICSVTPNDLKSDGITLDSNSLVVDIILPSISFISPTPTNGTTTSNKFIPVFIEANNANYKNYSYSLYNSTGLVSNDKYYGEDRGVSGGYYHTCALLNNGNITCWGSNTYNQSNNYTQGNAVGVSLGGYHTCALLNTGNVTCWGRDDYGQNANYTQGNAIGVSMGTSHTCALLNTGNVTCWGSNTDKQSNNYTQGNATGVSAGSIHTCALLKNGNITCWGQSNYGKSNNYTQGDAIGVSAGGSHTCALLKNGNITCWGYNGNGQSNNYTQGDAIGVSAGESHTCALLNNGNVDCWGYNYYGQSEDYADGNATGVSAASYDTCFLLNNGNITCQGRNDYGEANSYTKGDAKKQSLYTFQFLSDGNYYLNATACDVYGNCNSTETRTITLQQDMMPPSISFISPTPANGTITQNASAEINVGIAEANLNEFKWNWNAANYTFYDDSLKLMFNFDNNSVIGENSTYAVDVSKYSNNGTISGAIWNSSGKFGGAYSFDGINSYMTLDPPENFSSNGSGFSIFHWIYLRSDVNDQYLIGRYGSSNNGYRSYIRNNGSGPKYMAIDGWPPPGPILNLSQWYFVGFTANSSGYFREYVNGQFIANGTQAGRLDKGVLEIGKAAGFTLQYFNGMMDEIRIFSRELSAAEIQQQYYSNLQKFNSTQWYFYSNQSFNEGTYTYSAYAKDTVGNSNSTEQRTIISRIYPTISFLTPTPASGTLTTNKFIPVFIQADDANYKNYSYSLYNSTGLVSNDKYYGEDRGVSGGDYHTCALLNNGNITCWGRNSDGQSGNYTQGNAISVAGGYHTCALLNNGNITCWGKNQFNQSTNYTQGNAIGISGCNYLTCALLNTGNVTCWGENSYGQAANYTQGNAIGISVGGYHTCALLNNGNITCWGSNSDGQSNNYTQGNAIGVSTGGYYTCALLNTGNITCWGKNNFGQVLNYTQGNAIGVSAGYFHACALLNTGNITCWGWNDDNQSTNYTLGNAKKQSFYTFQFLSDGNYYLNATACDSFNNCNSTETRTITVQYSFSCGNTITSNLNLDSDFNCAGNGMNLGADNLVIDCKGNKLIGSGAGIGIKATTSTNGYSFTMQNCTIVNFTLDVNASGAPGNYNGGNVVLINSNLTNLSNYGGNGGGSAGGRGGNVTLTNSNVSAINAYGGTSSASAPGNGGFVTLTNSSADKINSYGGTGGSFASYGGKGGSVILTNSKATTINAYGGNSLNNFVGSGGNVTLTGSNVTSIYAYGGNSGGHYAGNGGSIVIADSNITLIDAYGGSGNPNVFEAGSGGNVSIINSELNLESLKINLTYGVGINSNGTSGFLTLNQTAFKNTFGKTKFFYVSTNQTSISSIISISNNLISVSSETYADYNASANLTLYGLIFGDPVILRNGATCPANICKNLSFSGGTLNFNVTGFTNYSVTESQNLTAPSSLPSANTVYYLQNDISSPATCFNVQADNITLDCQGNKLIGSGTGDGINATTSASAYNLTIKNCNISNFTNSINANGVAGLNGGSVTIINSNLNDVNTFGDTSSNGGISGDVLVTNSTISVINSYGAATSVGHGRAGANITLVDSIVITINDYGGQAPGGKTGGRGGYISITNSSITSIVDNGGTATTFLAGTKGGDGGNVTILNSALNLSSISININRGTSAVSQGAPGNLFLNQTSFTNNYGAVKFPYLKTSNTTFSSIISISNNLISVNSTNYNSYNVSANLTLYGLSFAHVRILREGVDCPSNICKKLSYSGGILVFNVTGFSNYSADNLSCGDTITVNITLEEDIAGCAGNGLKIGADNIVLDCNSYDINGSNVGFGINVTGFNNALIKNCDINSFSKGIGFTDSNNSQVLNLSSIAGDDGIYISSSENILLADSIFEATTYNGITALNSPNLSVANCTAISSNGNGISLDSSHNSNLNVLVDAGTNGILAESSENITISFSNITAQNYGISIGALSSSRNVLISDSNISAVAGGVYILNSDNNSIINSAVEADDYGIDLEGSPNTGILIKGSIVHVINWDAIYISGFSNTQILNTTATSDSEYGIWLTSTTGNTIINSSFSGAIYDFYSDAASDTAASNLDFSTANISFDSLDVAINKTSAIPANAGNLKNLSNYIDITGGAGSWIMLNMSYNASLIPAFEQTLKIYEYNGTDWILANTTSSMNNVDAVRKVVYANITSFSTFGIFGNVFPASLNIFDDTDTLAKNVHEIVKFYANYTSANAPVNGTEVFCEIKFNLTGDWEGLANMTYKSSSKLYEYSRTFQYNGNYSFNVLCNGTLLNYDELSALDNFTIGGPSFVSPNLVCGIEESQTCENGTALLRLKNDTGGYENAHVQAANTSDYNPGTEIYNNTLCCKSNYQIVNNGGNATTAFLRLSNYTDAHAEDALYPDYLYNVYFGVIDSTPPILDVGCALADSSCPVDYTCLISMASSEGDNSTNAHVGSCGLYTRKVCCIISEDTPPTVSLINPSDGYYSNSSGNVFTCNSADNKNLASVTVYVWNSSNSTVSQTTTPITGKTNETNWTVTLSEGIYHWNCKVSDSASQEAWALVNRTMTVDTTSPTIQFVNPTETSGALLNKNSILVNVTANDLHLANITIYLYNSTKDLVNEATTALSPNFVQFSGLSDGMYYFNATSYDLALNSISTGTKNVTLDSSSPLINFIYPTPDNGTSTKNKGAEINVSITESALGEFKFNWNKNNYTFYNDSLILMMNFDNNSAIGENSDKAVDVSKNSISNGTITSATLVSGKYGNALHFTNSTYVSYVLLTDISNFPVSNSPRSFGFWYKIDAGVSADGTILTYGTGSNWLYIHADAANNRWIWHTANGGDYCTFPTTFKTNWTYVVFAYNGDLNVSYYENGDYNRTCVSTNGQIQTQIEPLLYHSIGGGFSGNGNPCSIGNRCYDGFQGGIDEFRVWNRSLSTDEVKQQYQSNLQKYSSAQWYFYSNKSLPSEATYIYYASAKDTIGNSNSTEERTLKYSVYPQINFTYPTPPSGTVTANKSAEINVSIDEENLDEFKFSWNGTNTTFYDSSLVLMMNLDNNSALGENATKVVDVSRYSNNGTIYGTAFWNSSGKFGGAYQFDGINDYIDVNSIQFSSSIGTASLWAKPNPTNAGDILSNGGYYDDFRFSEGYWGFYLGSEYRVTGVSMPPANVWTYITLTWNSSGTRLYFNGTLMGQNTNGPPASARSGLKVGTSPGSELYFNGSIDEVRVYNYSLSAAEIKQHYQSNLQKYNLTQWYFYSNQSLPSEATYTYYASAKDTAGNENSTEERTVKYSIYPQINFTYPTPPSGTVTANKSAEINVSIDEENLNEFKFSWNGTNTTFYDSSLVLMMNLDNNSALGENATKVVDVSRYSNNGTISGAIWNSSGKFGGAYQFTEYNGNYILIPDSSSLDNINGMTIEAWIYWKRGTIGQYRTIFGKWDSPYEYYFGIRDSTQKLTWGMNGGNFAYSSLSVPMNAWTYVTVSFDDSADHLDFYLNGEKDGTGQGYSFSSLSGTSPARIGSTYGDNFFNGTIDEVRVWNRSLSAAEIKQHYQSNLQKYNLTQWYFYSNQSNLSYASYNYSASAKDTFGNENSTETRTLTVSYSFSCGDTITSSLNLSSDFNCAGNGMIVGAENITIDCKGHTLTGSNAGTGINISGFNNFLIQNCIINNFKKGIEARNSNNSQIINSTSNSIDYGIYVTNSGSLQLVGSISNATTYYDGMTAINSPNISMINCTAISLNGVGISFTGAGNNNILNTNVSASANNGIFISASPNNTIINSNVTAGNWGISIDSSSDNNLIVNSSVDAVTYGIYILSSGNNTIISSNVEAGDYGIDIEGAPNNDILIIDSTSHTTNFDAIYISGFSNTKIINCTAISDGEYGVYLTSTTGNTIINSSFTGLVYDFYSDTGTDTAASNLDFSTANISFDSLDVAIIRTSAIPDDTANLKNISRYIDITGGAGSWIMLNMSYNDTELPSGINEKSLKLYENTGTWALVPGSKVDTVNNVVSGNITSFSTFGPMSSSPIITYVSGISNVLPNEDSFVLVNFSFIAYDLQGASHLNHSSAAGGLNKSGEDLRQNLSCRHVGDIDANNANYSCSVQMWYWDSAGSWTVNASIQDNESVMATNESTTFAYDNLVALKVSPPVISWNAIARGAANQIPASGNFSVIRNTGNANITENNISVLAAGLIGKTDSSYQIYAENFTASPNSGISACSGTQLGNNSYINIIGTSLPRGNESSRNMYYCLASASDNLIKQDYSTISYPWYIKITIALALIVPRRRKKKSVLEAINLVSELDDELKKRYNIGVEDIAAIVNKLPKKEVKESLVPLSLFKTDGLGPLESLVKYMKENMNLKLSEIAVILERDERTIWTTYKNASSKKKEKILAEEKSMLPLSIFSDRKLSILESVVTYLHNLGIKNPDIARMLKKDARNIYTLYSRAKIKLSN